MAAGKSLKRTLSALDEVKEGAFVRTAQTFRDEIPSARFPAEAGRYHLYVSYACPWASRCLATLALKGISRDVISVTVVGPVWVKTKPGEDEHRGWPIGLEKEYADTTEDPIWGAKTVREVYDKAAPGHDLKKFTVPILVDKKEKVIVNNESSEIVRFLNTSFDEWAVNKEMDLYPEDLREAIDEVNEWVYPWINDGVYKCGFAHSQEAYEAAIDELYRGLDRAEEILSSQRYLAGNILTEADIRLAVTLFRFDAVYITHFKCTRGAIREYPALRNYVRDMYQLPGVADTVDLTHIKHHYYKSHKTLNPYAIVPVESGKWPFDGPHNRDSVGEVDPRIASCKVVT